MSESFYPIRMATPDDVPTLVEMCHQLQAHITEKNPALFTMAPGWRQKREEFYKTCIADADRHLVVGCAEDGTVFGMGLGTVVNNPNFSPQRFGSIDDFWIAPYRRRQGIGTKLINHLLRFFRHRSVEALTLSFAVGNVEAQNFWNKLGFHPALVMSNANLSAVEERLTSANRAFEMQEEG